MPHGFTRSVRRGRPEIEAKPRLIVASGKLPSRTRRLIGFNPRLEARLLEMPSVVHPVKFNICGFVFEVVSYVPLSDEQAQKVALMTYYRTKPKKKDRNKIFTAITTFDENSSGLL